MKKCQYKRKERWQRYQYTNKEHQNAETMLKSLITLEIFFTFINTQSTTHNPYSTYNDCCELNLMDSNLQVAIESSRNLPRGRFTALKARVCTTEPIYIQIWKQVNETMYEFKWQTQYLATQTETFKAYTVIRFDNNPVLIEATDRLGVYNPSTNASLKFAIPYEFDRQTSSTMYFSRQRFDFVSVFTIGLVIDMEDLRWPRTFTPFLSFCQSISDCPELTSDNVMTTTYDPYIGYIPKSCCNKIVSCDVGDAVKDGLTDQKNQVTNLQDTIDVLEKTLQNLLNSQYITGTCPDGFSPGIYGVGSCYIVHRELLQMAQAVIKCRDLYSARLLNIQSEQEDRFVKNFLLNTTISDVERFWTSGMYNLELRNWFWYDDDFLTKMPFGAYRNWKDGQELAATSIYDVCSVFTVNQTKSADYWEKVTCTDLNFYVCEIPKICL